ncbi:hypothetical protein SK128_016326 [Halocaridina rubra]|uniref:Transporter n=1 Tax=Halocaridina rubra TaxID=373956 RepID=A0AAN8WMY1_HALRR
MGREDENNQRGNWDSKLEYFLSLLGYAVGIGNVWRFPYLCYRNGGGAFLIPYLLMLFLVGIPLFLLETAVGQFSSSGCLTLYNVCPVFKGIGYSSIMVTLIASTYYSVVVSYPLVYLFKSFATTLPWASCDNEWNTEGCVAPVEIESVTNSSEHYVSSADEYFHNHILQISTGIDDPDGLVWPISLANLFIWTVVFLCIFRGVKVVGKVVYLTTLFPYVMLFILFFRGVTLPGAWEGILYYISPNFERLLDFRVWVDAAVQISFSLGPGFGSLITMSSFNRFHNDCQRDAILIPVLNCATSIFAGFVVFSVLGFMSVRTGVPIYEVNAAGPGLAFITYPEALSLMPLAPLWSVLFFLMLFFLGIGSIFVQCEAMVVSIVDEFPYLRRWKSFIAFSSSLFMFLAAQFCCSRGGMYVLHILDTYSATVPIILSCLCETIVFAFIYGSGRVTSDIQMMISKPISCFWYLMWLVFTPLVLLFIFFNTLVNLTPGSYQYYIFPDWAVRVGWLTASLSMGAIPLYMFYYMLVTEGSFTKRLKHSFTPSSSWGPALEHHREEWLNYNSRNPLRYHHLYPKYSRPLNAWSANTSNALSDHNLDSLDVVIPLSSKLSEDEVDS